MLFSRYPFASSIALVALLSEILIVMLSGVPFSPGQIYMELLVCSYTSMAILALMVVAIIALLLRRWRGGLNLPRTPDTLAAVMSYICASQMLDDFEGLECLDKGERDRRIVALKKRYEYGQRRGVDGVVRWAVDEQYGDSSASL